MTSDLNGNKIADKVTEVVSRGPLKIISSKTQFDVETPKKQHMIRKKTINS